MYKYHSFPSLSRGGGGARRVGGGRDCGEANIPFNNTANLSIHPNRTAEYGTDLGSANTHPRSVILTSTSRVH